jgi:hypothetical protein
MHSIDNQKEGKTWIVLDPTRFSSDENQKEKPPNSQVWRL